MIIQAVLKYLLEVPLADDHKPNSVPGEFQPGLFGGVRAALCVTETQQRGSLHVSHALASFLTNIFWAARARRCASQKHNREDRCSRISCSGFVSDEHFLRGTYMMQPHASASGNGSTPPSVLG